MKRIQTSSADAQRRCETAGGLAAGARVPAPEMPTAQAFAALERALVTGRAPHRIRWRRVFVPIFVAAGVAVALLVAFARPRPLTYVVEGDAPAAREEVAAGGAGAVVRFSDGTAIALQPNARGRIEASTARGARFRLARGRVTVAVTKRARADWTVAAGPFEVRVTGTRFDVSWPGDGGDLQVQVTQGSVLVRGPGLADGVAVSAGRKFSTRVAERRPAFSSAPGPERAVNAPPVPSAPATLPAAPGAPPRAKPVRAPFGQEATRPGAGLAAASSMDESAAGPDTEAAPAIGAAGPASPPALDAAADPPHALALPPGLAAGGEACRDEVGQISFDSSVDNVTLVLDTKALLQPTVSHTRSWCGAGSLTAPVRFSFSGPRSFRGTLPGQSGAVLIDLPGPVDLTDRTVSVRIYVEGPPGAQFGAGVFAVTPTGWVDGNFHHPLRPGQWWTVSHTFRAKNRLFSGGVASVDTVMGLAVQISAMGETKDRTWSGVVYMDELGWK